MTIETWDERLDIMDSFADGLRGEAGVLQKIENNRSYLLALRVCLRRSIATDESTIGRNSSEQGSAQDFMVKIEHITELRKEYMDDGGV